MDNHTVTALINDIKMGVIKIQITAPYGSQYHKGLETVLNDIRVLEQWAKEKLNTLNKDE